MSYRTKSHTHATIVVTRFVMGLGLVALAFLFVGCNGNATMQHRQAEAGFNEEHGGPSTYEGEMLEDPLPNDEEEDGFLDWIDDVTGGLFSDDSASELADQVGEESVKKIVRTVLVRVGVPGGAAVAGGEVAYIAGKAVVYAFQEREKATDEKVLSKNPGLIPLDDDRFPADWAEDGYIVLKAGNDRLYRTKEPQEDYEIEGGYIHKYYRTKSGNGNWRPRMKKGKAETDFRE